MITISQSNLSLAWAEAFVELMARGTSRAIPLVINVHSLAGRSESALEDLEIRTKLDELLCELDEQHVHTVAGTIFPISMWDRALPKQAAAQDLYSRYAAIFPKIEKAAFSKNQHGIYFQRFVNYNYQRKAKITPAATPPVVNQLENLLSAFRAGTKRTSALQLAANEPESMELQVFDPTRDFSMSRQRGFPCLQQVSFGLDGESLCLVALYANQYIFEKGYGNLLGLYRLGTFVADQLNLKLDQVTCIATVGKLGDKRKSDLGALRMICESKLPKK